MNTEQQNEWVSVKERLPERDTRVLICLGSDYVTFGKRNRGDWYYTSINAKVPENNTVEFWMHIPKRKTITP